MFYSRSRNDHVILAVLCLAMVGCSEPDPPSMEKVAEYVFRRSYAGHEDLSDSAVALMHSAMPELITEGVNDPTVTHRLTQLGIIKADSLHLNAEDVIDQLEFDYFDPMVFTLDEAKFCQIYWDTTTAELTLGVNVNGTMLLHRIEGDGIGLGYSHSDLIPGGFEEIIVFNPYYIMNGDNYELDVYEVKEHH